MPGPLSGKVALVTGASRGIGYATALALAKAGAHVFTIARTVGALEELADAILDAGGSATHVPMDVRDGPGILRLAQVLNERFERLDVLVGNAGILGPMSPLGHVEPKDWDEVIAVNVTANFHLIRAMDPLLQKSKAGRVVLVTSGAASSNRAYWGPYSISKAALDALARTYAAETATTNVRVNLFNPGPTRTRMRAAAMPGEDPMELKTAYPVADKIVEMCLPDFQDSGKLYDYRAGRLLSPQKPA